jgi:hypothetical protein
MDRDVEKLIREAIANLKEGRAEDALLVLERTVDPKFGSRVEAMSRYAGSHRRSA